MKNYRCGNCGHVQEADDQLTEMGFVWLDDWTSRISCSNCGTYTIQRISRLDDQGRPNAGEFLVVRTKNKIRKGVTINGKRTI